MEGAGVNMVTDFKAASVIANGVREEGVREKGVIVSEAGKEKGDTFIEE